MNAKEPKPPVKKDRGTPTQHSLTTNQGAIRHQFISEITDGNYSFRMFSENANDIIHRRRGKYEAFEGVGKLAKHAYRGVDVVIALAAECLSIYTGGRSRSAPHQLFISDEDRASDDGSGAVGNAMWVQGYSSACQRLKDAVKDQASKDAYVNALPDGICGVLVKSAGLEGYIRTGIYKVEDKPSTHPQFHRHPFQAVAQKRVSMKL